MKKLIRNLAVHLALLSLVYTAFHPRALAQTAQRIRLEEGTQVRLKLMEPLTSATAKVGQVVSFEVLDEIRIGESLVIAEGAAAWGTVVEAEGKRYMGRAGKLALQIEYVKAVDGTKVPLRASDQASQGKGKGVATGVAVGATAVFFWPAAPLFLLMKGKQAEIPKGFHVTAFVDGDRLIAPRVAREIAAPVNVVTPAFSSTGLMQASLRTGAVIAQPSATEISTVSLSSDPYGAEVEIDGTYFGNTPGLLRLPAGMHTVTLHAAGYAVWKRTLNLNPGSDVTVKAALVRTRR